MRRCGGRFLADLADHDPRYQDYAASRSLPGTPDAARRPRLWARRRDVCWLGATRVDLTEVPDRGHQVPVLPYAAADLGPVQRDLRVTAVGRGYPVTLAVDQADVARVLITARGYDQVFRPGDRVVVQGRLRGGAGHQPFVSVDDATGHLVDLQEGADHG